MRTHWISEPPSCTWIASSYWFTTRLSWEIHRIQSKQSFQALQTIACHEAYTFEIVPNAPKSTMKQTTEQLKWENAKKGKSTPCETSNHSFFHLKLVYAYFLHFPSTHFSLATQYACMTSTKLTSIERDYFRSSLTPEAEANCSPTPHNEHRGEYQQQSITTMKTIQKLFASRDLSARRVECTILRCHRQLHTISGVHYTSSATVLHAKLLFPIFVEFHFVTFSKKFSLDGTGAENVSQCCVCIIVSFQLAD